MGTSKTTDPVKMDSRRAYSSEQELAQMYSVSVGTVRKAVEGLVEDGLLVKQQGKGTFLKQPNFENSLIRFLDYVIKRRVHSATRTNQKVEVCDAIPEVNAELGLGHTDKLLYIERVRKHEDVVVLSERIWLPERLFKNLEEIPIAEFGNLLYPFYYQHCGQFVSSATERLTFEKNIKDSYLNNHLEDPLVKVCRIAKNLEGVAVEYRESYGLADNFHYEITIN